MSSFRIATAMLLACGLAAAQGEDIKEKIKKQMEEISRLMRDSERRLLELTRVDRIAAQQQEIVERLDKLLPDPERSPEQAADAEKQRDELEKKQTELQRKLDELKETQRKAGELSVEELKKLLRSLPRQQQQGQGQGEDKKQQERRREREKRLREQREREQREQQMRRGGEQEKKEQPEQRTGGRKPESDTEQAARMKRIQAWIARLPPEEQARIARNDFSSIPMRYRRLVREYTALRAKREAERAEEEDR